MSNYYALGEDDGSEPRYECPHCNEEYYSSEAADACCNHEAYYECHFKCDECGETYEASSNDDYDAIDLAKQCCARTDLPTLDWACAECHTKWHTISQAVACCGVVEGEPEEIERPDLYVYKPPPTLEQELTKTDDSWEKELA